MRPNRDTDVTVLVFESGRQRFAVPVNRVCRVAACPDLLLPARYPDFVLGCLNFRGHTCTVLSLPCLLGFGEAAPPGFYSPLLVLPAEHGYRALAADDLVATLPAGSWSPLPVGEDLAGYPVTCLAGDGSDAPPALLDIDALLLAEEEACLAQLEAAVRERIADLRRLDT